MKKLDFQVPFSAFAPTTFINCFASVYLYCEGMKAEAEQDYECAQREGNPCTGCGHCAESLKAIQEKFFFLFDTVCGHSSLRCRFDGTPTEMEKLINDGGFYDGGGSENIDFLFGFAGYDYRPVTSCSSFLHEITAAIDNDKPVITKLKNSSVPFCVITGYGDNGYYMPEFTGAQKAPDHAPNDNEIDTIYIIDKKTVPKYTLCDGLERIIHIMEYALKEDLWGGYMKKIGTYGPDSLGEDNPEGRKVRMNRLAATMWHTFNVHNFAEVFRVFLSDSQDRNIFDTINDVKKLGDPSLHELIHTISWRYGYTHDLAWSIIGLDECINWEDWKSHYYGDMLEVILLKLKENDEAVLECVKEIVQRLEK